MLNVQQLTQETWTTNGIRQAAHANVFPGMMITVLQIMEATQTSNGMRQNAHANVFL